MEQIKKIYRNSVKNTEIPEVPAQSAGDTSESVSTTDVDTPVITGDTPEVDDGEGRRSLEEELSRIEKLLEEGEVQRAPVDPLDFDIPGIDRGVVPRRKKVMLVTYYAATGNLKAAARYADIPYTTAASWKVRSPWWPEAVQRARAHADMVLDAQYTQILHEAQREILDRILNGDEVIVKGEKKRVKVKARDLAQITKGLQESRGRIRGTEEAGGNKASDEKRLKQLLKKFEEIGRQMGAKTIDGKAERVVHENPKVRENKTD